MPRSLLLLALATVLASGSVRADCELLYAPPQVRARLLAFHHANELRRAREQAHGRAAATAGKAAGPTGPARSRAAPAKPSARPR